MNLHEYQGKELLNSFGVRIQRGIVASSPEEQLKAAERLNEETGTSWYVVKPGTWRRRKRWWSKIG